MKSKNKNHETAPTIVEAAEQLFELARQRVPAEDVIVTVGEIVDAGLPWEDPDAFTRYLIWSRPNAVEPERMAASIRALLPKSIRSTVSTAHLLEEIKNLAFELGEALLDHRDQDRARQDAQRLLQTWIDRLSTSNEHWDIVLPIVNLGLDIRGEAVRIGPVLLVRDGLSRFIVHEDDSARLGEFGQWAVEHFDLHKPESRRRWSGALGDIAAYGKVAGLRGDQQGAIEQAKRDIDTALAILRVSYYLYGSWSGQQRFGTYGSFFDPVQRFGVMGTSSGGFRITLAARSPDRDSEAKDNDQEKIMGPVLATQVARREPGDFGFQMGRTDLPQPVIVAEAELHRRWLIIEQLSSVLWSEGGAWRELAAAARTFAEGIEAASPEDAFVKYVVALDVLLGREERGYAESQVTRISERLAFLLGEDDPNLRWRLFKSFKDLYGKRSGIVHGGATTDEAELYRLESMARLAILRLAWEIRKRDHSNLDAFVDWVRRMKFGEPFESTNPPAFLQISDHWAENTN